LRRAEADKPAPEAAIGLVVNDRHDIHHVRERGYVESPVRRRTWRFAPAITARRWKGSWRASPTVRRSSWSLRSASTRRRATRPGPGVCRGRTSARTAG
jgi:hypothetical protein